MAQPDLRLPLILVALLSIVSVIMSAIALFAPVSPRRIARAREFRLVDVLDRDRATLRIAESGPVELQIFDTSYKNPITLTFDPQASNPAARMTVTGPQQQRMTVIFGHSAAEAQLTGEGGAVESIAFPAPGSP